MLHVFNVTCGERIGLDVALATGRVAQLHHALHAHTAAPHDEQVLIISGGQILDELKPVAQYSGAGTESNPIFLVLKNAERYPCERNAHVVEFDAQYARLNDELRASIPCGASVDVLQQRCALARDALASCSHGVRLCATLADDHHLLHQGWCAVVAHLEDSVEACSKRIDKLKAQYDKLEQVKNEARELLKNFDNDVQILQRIPVARCLLDKHDTGHSSHSYSDSEHSDSDDVSLLHWIVSHEPQHRLDDLAGEVRHLLQTLDSNARDDLMTRRQSIEASLNQHDYRHIGGIEKRFEQLNEHLAQANSNEVDAKRLCELICAQESTLVSSADAQTLGELARVHKDNLVHLMQTLRAVVDAALKFDQSKVEVLNTVRQRMRSWLVATHDSLATAVDKLTLAWEQIKGLKQRLQVMRQVHDAPAVYCLAVVEIVRRRAFSHEYIEWSHDLVKRAQKLHSDESYKRDNLAQKLDKHFVKVLFQSDGCSLLDKVPDFATKPPQPFDGRLPALSEEHLRAIADRCPELSPMLRLPRCELLRRLSLDRMCTSDGAGGVRRDDDKTSASVAVGATYAGQFDHAGSGSMLDFSPSPAGGSAMATILCADNMESRKGQPSINSLASLDGMAVVADRPRTDSSNRDSTGDVQFALDAAVSDSEQHSVRSASVSKSAPIRIPATQRSCTLAHSSERFGTPDSQPANINSSGDLAVSPAEVLSASMVNKEIMGMRLTDTAQGVQAGRSGVDASCSTADLDSHTGDAQRAIFLEDLCRRMATIVTHELAALKQSAASVRSAAVDCRSENVGASVSASIEKSARALECRLQRDLNAAMEANRTMAEEDAANRDVEWLHRVDVERHKALDAEKQVGNYEALVRQKDDVIQFLEEKLASCDRSWSAKLEEAKADVVKQLTIDYELQLDDAKMQSDNKVTSLESICDSLRAELHCAKERSESLRVENERMLERAVDAAVHPNVPPAGGAGAEQRMTTLAQMDSLRTKHEHELKQTKLEMEKEFKERFNLLLKGVEEKHADLVARLQKEHQIEIRKLTKAHELSLCELRSQLAVCSSDSAHDCLVAAEEKHVDLAGVLAESMPAPTQTRAQAPPLATRNAMVDSVMQTDRACDEHAVRCVAGVLDRLSISCLPNDSVLDCSIMPADQPASGDEEQSAMVTGPSGLDTPPDGAEAAERSGAPAAADGGSGAQAEPVAGGTVALASKSPLGSPGCGSDRRSARTQTRLRCEHWLSGHLVLTRELHADCAAVLLWSADRQTYVLLSTGGTLYFVKERCARALGFQLPNEAGANVQSVVRVTSVDYCQIRKADNRYGLPYMTRFYRVEVDCLPQCGEPAHAHAHGHSAAVAQRADADAEQ